MCLMLEDIRPSMAKRIILFVLAVLSSVVFAEETALRPSARLLFAQPELLRPGACAELKEGGAGWILTDPVYWLKGTVLAAEVRSRRLDVCPLVAGKVIEQYSREEFNRLANARPCVSRPELVREEQVGVVRLRVDDWETPWAKRAANAYRLYQGHYLDKVLQKGEELEIEADLLTSCSSP